MTFDHAIECLAVYSQHTCRCLLVSTGVRQHARNISSFDFRKRHPIAITIRSSFSRPQGIITHVRRQVPGLDRSIAHRHRSYDRVLKLANISRPVVLLEQCQRGYANAQEAAWSDISRGMKKAEPATVDEHQIRVFWQRWHALVQQAPRVVPLQAAA